MPLRRFRRQYELLSQFEGWRVIGMMEAGWSAWRVVRQLGRSDCVLRRCWDQWFREIYESRFNLSSDNNPFHVWRPRGERFNPAYGLQRHTAPSAA
ncbi:uncharacterized protein TNCV_857211, partial [Trichonephila clavipes]